LAGSHSSYIPTKPKLYFFFIRSPSIKLRFARPARSDPLNMEDMHRINCGNPDTTNPGDPPTILLVKTAPRRNVPAIRIYTANDTLLQEEHFALFLSFVAVEKSYYNKQENVCTSLKV